MEWSRPKGVKLKMAVRKLRSDVNWQGPFSEKKRVKQGLYVRKLI
jgi:hypothetical protein